ncbi:hypothetical protein [Xanthomonas phage MUD8-T1]|uniref:Uncharacterized protein n=1 Tax=Xanthomonas phage MUD8-T1 TaxID=2886033 RepID=A0AAE8YN95_9CAUD|nr:hypothetical protein [Xanthomonas phage MUD8-T1]UGL62983.1 hypothetical protein [Xanthomonas phage R3-22-T1]
METITITTKEYKQLVANSEKLAALEAGGVDNWDFYWDSLYDAGFISVEDED